MAEQGSTWDREAWARLVGEQGFTSILVPADAGGWGFGMVEACVVLEEAGRALTPLPLASTMVGTVALTILGTPEQQARWLGEVVAGRTATLAIDGKVSALRKDGRWQLSGTKERVVDGATADIVVLTGELGPFVVQGEHLARAPRASLDTTRPLATLHLDGVAVEDDDTLPSNILGDVLTRAWVLLAAEQVGVAEAALSLAVEYAKVRKQFGKPIGSFQSIQHRCADMLVAVEMARSATWYAAWALDVGEPAATADAHAAAALASDAAFRCTADAIQIHGGIGFTWEHALHLYFKRARASSALLGEPAAHRAAVAAALLDRDTEAPWT
jgi:alkylation response protein AidB-like acyl-CoA dehydrogenase